MLFTYFFQKSLKEPTLQHLDQQEKRTKKSKLIEEKMNMQKELVSQTPSTNIVKRKVNKLLIEKSSFLICIEFVFQTTIIPPSNTCFRLQNNHSEFIKRTQKLKLIRYAKPPFLKTQTFVLALVLILLTNPNLSL